MSTKWSTRLRMVKCSSINFDEKYQRVCRPGHVKAIIENFNPVAFGCGVLGERDDGTLWGVDVQHRWSAAVELGIESIPCIVFDSEGAEHEARVFDYLNRCRVAVGGVDQFRAKLVYKDPESLKIQSVLRSYGYWINHHSNRRLQNITCPSAVIGAFRAGILDEVLDLIGHVTGRDDRLDKEAIKAYTIKTFHTLLTAWRDELDWGRVEEKLATVSYERWDDLVKSSSGTTGGRGAKIAKAFIEEIYNPRYANPVVFECGDDDE